MLVIRKGKLTLTIPASSLKKFKSAGWEVYTDSSSAEEPISEPTQETSIDHEDESEEESEGESEEESEEDVVYVDPEELATRPIKELDSDELRILAEYKGIDVSSITTTKGLRAALRSLE